MRLNFLSVAPHLESPIAPVNAHPADVGGGFNLGQNDHGFPASQGEPLAVDFSERYLACVRALHQRYAQAKRVLTIGGMSAWQAQPEILRTRAETARLLKSEGDRRVWTYRFEAFSWAHPRIDVHARMVDELEKFMPDKVLP